MGLLDRLFQRGGSADEALLAVATARGWSACGRSGMAMLPPSHAAADVHGLGGCGAPHCAGRSFELALGQQRRPAVVSHLEIAVSDDQEHVYDMVTWQRQAGTLMRFEAELGEGAGQHHRLGDRFNPGGAATHRLPGGAVLRIGRDADAGRAQAWCAAAGWGELMRLAQTRPARLHRRRPGRSGGGVFVDRDAAQGSGPLARPGGGGRGYREPDRWR